MLAVSNHPHSHFLSRFRGRRKQNGNAFTFLLLPCTDSRAVVFCSLSEVRECIPLLPTMPHLGPHCSSSLPSLAPRVFAQEIRNIALSLRINNGSLLLLCAASLSLFCPVSGFYLGASDLSLCSFAATGPLGSRLDAAHFGWHCLVCLTLLP